MGDESESASGEALPPCELCRRPLGAGHFRVRNMLVCAACAADLARPAASGDWLRRALARGIGASMGVALAWFLATRITSLDLSPLAVVAGIIVGATVRRSVAGRGGWRLQMLAVALTYLAICVRFIPPVFQGMGDAIRTTETHQPAASAPHDVVDSPRPPPAPPTQSNQTSVPKTLLVYLLFTLMAWGLVLAGPFLVGPTLLGIVSLLAGMWAAWRLNRATLVQGPFNDCA